MMESIQLAQMLADLSDLNAAQDSQAAMALVNANKAAAPTAIAADASKSQDHAPVRPGQRHHQRVGSASSIISRTASPAKFDKFGRRILTPPMSRTNSAQGSIPGTPRREAEVSITPQLHTPTSGLLSICLSPDRMLKHWGTQLEDDVERANSLMALYDIRAKLKEQDNTSLMKLRDKIAALQARQQQSEKKDGGPTSDPRQSRYTYPKTPA
ncbi:hypothetical protein B0H63DRAFT_41085 [Podospora didyma]|uniref:Uncharacterized protein n=1 Tax=Podospora didyma TaxID=330526 RepID=A0AAE0U8C8_9PEZI|nr:hypothetical protein B0H63DRAFT_41085 [Podospora didyma]